MHPDDRDFIATRGRYQPFRLPDGTVTGAGLSFYKRTELRSINIASDHPDRDSFIEGAVRQASMYEDFIRLVTENVAVDGATYIDTCCNSGYFPFRFSQLGADATGIDIGDYARLFNIVNRFLGTNAEFVRGAYDMMRHDFPALGDRQFDIVSNIAFICHDSDPTFLVHSLARRAKKALLLFSLFPESNRFFIEYGNVPKKYFGEQFPICFDNDVQVSACLLRYALTDLGFSRVIEAERRAEWPFRGQSWRCFLAIR